ncbi:MAG: carbohydrate ABC transporter permease [Eisenbergiella massiliensis]
MKKKLKPYNIIRILICVFVLFLIVFPFAWLFLSTFKLQKDIIKWPPTLWPKAWTIKNYIQVWSRIPLATYIKNTVIFAGIVSVCSALLDSLAGYAFARLEFKGKETIFNIVLLTMLIPFQIIMIPLYLELHTFGILNTYIGLILPRAASAYGMFFMRSFYMGLPKSLEEAARIDGMNEFEFIRKSCSRGKPAFVTFFILPDV